MPPLDSPVAKEQYQKVLLFLGVFCGRAPKDLFSSLKIYCCAMVFQTAESLPLEGKVAAEQTDEVYYQAPLLSEGRFLLI